MRICVIGGGASGLTSIKQCMDEGFDVICYEKTNDYGGLWRYRDEDMEGVPSIYKSLDTNTSKECMAFSDFPPPSNFPNYLPHKLVCKYLESYAKHFNLEPKIECNVEVVEVTYNEDYDLTGKWKVTAKYLNENRTVTNVFDGVMICVGHNTKPYLPSILGLEKFKGKVLHTHSYKTPDVFKDQTVVVVGLGNSSADVAVELSTVCSQVYLSSKGKWILPILSKGGIPSDTKMSRFSDYAIQWMPSSWFISMNKKVANSHLDHELYNLKPDYELFKGLPSMNDNLPKAIITGRVAVRKNIKTFTEHGVIFEGCEEETKCDAVILGTGYKYQIPFLDPSIIDDTGDSLDLYKLVFAPKLKHPHTLAVIGVVASIIGLFSTFEMQARWFTRVVSRKVKLPTKEEMLQSVSNETGFLKFLIPESRTAPIFVFPISYNDQIAEMIGVKPNFWYIFLTDFKLWWKLVFGPFLSYHYRLSGPNSWLGAREAIFGFYDRFKDPFKI